MAKRPDLDDLIVPKDDTGAAPERVNQYDVPGFDRLKKAKSGNAPATAEPPTPPQSSAVAEVAPAAQAPEVAQGAEPYVKTLSYKMTASQYRRLRRYVASQEELTGGKTTHQSIFENAVMRFLKDAGM